MEIDLAVKTEMNWKSRRALIVRFYSQILMIAHNTLIAVTLAVR